MPTPPSWTCGDDHSRDAFCWPLLSRGPQSTPVITIPTMARARENNGLVRSMAPRKQMTVVQNWREVRMRRLSSSQVSALLPHCHWHRHASPCALLCAASRRYRQPTTTRQTSVVRTAPHRTAPIAPCQWRALLFGAAAWRELPSPDR